MTKIHLNGILLTLLFSSLTIADEERPFRLRVGSNMEPPIKELARYLNRASIPNKFTALAKLNERLSREMGTIISPTLVFEHGAGPMLGTLNRFADRTGVYVFAKTALKPEWFKTRQKKELDFSKVNDYLKHEDNNYTNVSFYEVKLSPEGLVEVHDSEEQVVQFYLEVIDEKDRETAKGTQFYVFYHKSEAAKFVWRTAISLVLPGSMRFILRTLRSVLESESPTNYDPSRSSEHLHYEQVPTYLEDSSTQMP